MVWWKKVNSWSPELCEWCEEIKFKYHIRTAIAEQSGLDEPIVQEFDNLSHFATCPLHKELTVHPSFAKDLRKFGIGFDSEKIDVDVEIPIVIFNWWSNSYDYQAKWIVFRNVIDFYKNGNYVATLPNQNLIKELLILCSKEELEKISEFISKFDKQKILKALELEQTS